MSAFPTPGRQKLPRVLLCAADVGCGHGRAAEAVALALKKRAPGIGLKLVDALATAPRWFSHLYRDLYLLGARHFPRANGWLYDRTDIDGLPPEQGLGVMLETIALRRFCDSPEVREADIIVCTHFLCARVLSQERRRGLLEAKLAVIVTDQHPHAIWRIPNADLFVVASDAAAEEMFRQGIGPSRTIASGIPIDGRFAAPLDQSRARARQSIPPTARVILLSGGGLGLGGLDQALEGILSSGADVYTVVVCGRNDRLQARLTRRVRGLGDRCRVIGQTNRMHELMAAADLLVGKPGGLTTAEATALGLPMILLRPLPGQEDRNAAILTHAGAAVLEADPFKAGQAAAALVGKTSVLETMRDNAVRFGRGDSAATAAAAILELFRPVPATADFIQAGRAAAARA